MAATRTVRDLLTRAMRMATIVGAGETMDADDASDALISLNLMLDAWQAENLYAYDIVDRTHPLTAGVSAYTVGTSGVIAVPRPVRIEYAFTRDSVSYDRPISNVTQDEFVSIGLKSLGNDFPSVLFYETGYPNGTINLWPKPLSGLTLYFGAWVVLSEYANLDVIVSLPPGYEDAIVFSIAERLCPEYGKLVSPDLARLAAKSRAAVQQNNLPDVSMGCEYIGDGSNQFLPWYAYRAGAF